MGRNPEEILAEAHQRGVIDRKRFDAFDEGAIVIDVLDARTNKLVFRNFAKGAVLENISPAARHSSASMRRSPKPWLPFSKSKRR